jgi:hypothetical protein
MLLNLLRFLFIFLCLSFSFMTIYSFYKAITFKKDKYKNKYIRSDRLIIVPKQGARFT